MYNYNNIFILKVHFYFCTISVKVENCIIVKIFLNFYFLMLLKNFQFTFAVHFEIIFSHMIACYAIYSSKQSPTVYFRNIIKHFFH